MSKPKILVVDDELKIAEVIRSYLEFAGYDVLIAQTGNEAMALFNDENPSLVILDLMLPDISGEEICRLIRSKSRVPVIMVTAKVDEDDIIKGLDIGADDYITKPFSPRQLTARVAALLRRTADEPVPLSNRISLNNKDLELDITKHEVKKRGTVVNLTPNEYNILLTLIKYPHKAFSREELIRHALSDDFDGFDRTIDAYIKNIRQKIETDPRNPGYIITVYGVGYRFGGEENET